MPTLRSSKSCKPVLRSSTLNAGATSASSLSEARPEESGDSLPNSGSKTDWEYVRRMQATDAPIPYDPNDPDDGPYDPNDDAAVDAYWDEGLRLGLVTRGLDKRPIQPK